MAGEVVRVPSADDMEDLTFLKHMDRRHSDELADETPLAEFPHWTPENLRLYRLFHDRLHDIAVPGQHDHEHLF